jgi:hypothetical protein
MFQKRWEKLMGFSDVSVPPGWEWTLKVSFLEVYNEAMGCCLMAGTAVVDGGGG